MPPSTPTSSSTPHRHPAAPSRLDPSHPARSPHATGQSLRDRLGVCQWFHFEDHAAIDRAAHALADLNIRHLRTGISWADYHRPGGPAFYRRLFDTLRTLDLVLLVSVWHTPPSLAENGACNGPPRRLRDYADFIDTVLDAHGQDIAALELWNEPNNRYKWDFPGCDPRWSKFAEMLGSAAYWARQRRVTTVLGGMIPVDPHWLDLMHHAGVLQYIDVVAIHAFPGMWFPHHPNWDWQSHWTSWADKLDSIRPAARGRPIWVTETGLATWDLALQRVAKYELQEHMLRTVADAITAPGPQTIDRSTRFYWYSLIDLDPHREAIEGFHVDENEYHMGLIDPHGHRKSAYHLFKHLVSSGAGTHSAR